MLQKMKTNTSGSIPGPSSPPDLDLRRLADAVENLLDDRVLMKAPFNPKIHAELTAKGFSYVRNKDDSYEPWDEYIAPRGAEKKMVCVYLGGGAQTFAAHEFDSPHDSPNVGGQ
jgi:hypothetical protein